MALDLLTAATKHRRLPPVLERAVDPLRRAAYGLDVRFSLT
jgi:hypothetical protein